MATVEEGEAVIATCDSVEGESTPEAVTVEVNTPKPEKDDDLEVVNPRTKRPLAPYSQRELWEKKSPPPTARRSNPPHKTKRVSNGTNGDTSPGAVQHAQPFTPPGPNVHDPCPHRYVPPSPRDCAGDLTSPRPAAERASAPAPGQRVKAASGRDALRISREAPLHTSRDGPSKRPTGSPGPTASHVSPRPAPLSQRSPPPAAASPAPAPAPAALQQPQLASKDSRRGVRNSSTGSAKLSGQAAAATAPVSDPPQAATAAAGGRSPAVMRSKSACSPFTSTAASAGAAKVQGQAPKQGLPAKVRSSPLGGARAAKEPSTKAIAAAGAPTAKAASNTPSRTSGVGARAAAGVVEDQAPALEPTVAELPATTAAEGIAQGPDAPSAGAEQAVPVGGDSIERADMSAVTASQCEAEPQPAAGSEAEEGTAAQGQQRSSAAGAASHAATDEAITDSEACAEEADAAGAGKEGQGAKAQLGAAEDKDGAVVNGPAVGLKGAGASGKAPSAVENSKGLGGGSALEVEDGPAAAGCRCVVM